MNTGALKTALYEWANPEVNSAVTLVHDYQPLESEPGAPRPDLPFVAIRLGNDERIGTPDRDWDPDTERVKFEATHRITVSFRVFGSESIEARDIVKDLLRAKDKQTARIRLRDRGVVLVREAGTINQTAAERAGFQQRAQLDFDFRYSDEYEDDPGVLEEFSFSGSLEESADDPNPNFSEVTIT